MPSTQTQVILLNQGYPGKSLQDFLREAGFTDPDVGLFEIVSANRPTYEMTHSLTTWIQNNKKGEAPQGSLVLVSPEAIQGLIGIATFQPNGQEMEQTTNTVVKIFETKDHTRFYAVELDDRLTRVNRAAGPLDRKDRMDLESLEETLG